MSKPLHIPAFDNLCWNSSRFVPPCQKACPLGTDVSGYIMAAMMGEYREAFRLVKDRNPLPSVCSRICHHPCEDQCIRGRIDQPISIRALKRFVIENTDKEFRQRIPDMNKAGGKRVAVIGSGPAGLSAAHDLALQGHQVTIFEKYDRLGGVLGLAIPAFILPNSILKEDISRIKSLGVRFQTGAEIKKAEAIKSLFDTGFSSVLLATGAHDSVILNNIDYSLPKIFSALAFLIENKNGKNSKMEGRALIIGGGNVAVDSARLCIRKGVSKVDVYCLEKQNEMAAFDWEIERARREGVEFHSEQSLVETTANPDGSITCRFADVKHIVVEDGKIKPVIDKRRMREEATDYLIIAAGQKIGTDHLNGIPFNLTPQGSVSMGAELMISGFPGLFIAGDMASFPGTLIDSIASGKKAAESIEVFLNGGKSVTTSIKNGTGRLLSEIPEKIISVFPKRKRQIPPETSSAKAKKSYAEPEKTYSLSAAKEEASRCLNCAVCGNCIYEREQLCLQTGSRLL
ncbi:MAG: FAD-dependent oxidoreductase [Desulfobacterales bacterium]